MSSGPRVLIVDDEERFRNTLRKLLAVSGVDAATAGSGEEALKELGSRDYDVILLDVKMPGMSGIEALARIKKIAPGIEVIVLTGHACVDVAVEIMKLGGYEYLLKPCPLDDLLLKIDAAFERKQARLGKPRRATAPAETGK
ncbi:response regulator [Desulfoferrobacter suflitae]|uniref:response regulator n=1 Tax=Desulfoferrobacter suflitae TaxID=2865782 RepID=UPI0021645826|nr:response regulator [Desulfoferrobacter suflitae]MCK8601599.1 response regulator [Desulfoferrobacter suflitae]